MTVARNAVVLGSTGAVGTLHVDAFAADPATHVVALAAAGHKLEVIAYQAVELGVFGIALEAADLSEVNAALDAANERAGTNVRPEILIGAETITHAASAGVDLVVNTIYGIAGLGPSLAALTSGAHLKVANTETLLSSDLLKEVVGGPLLGRLSSVNPALSGIQRALDRDDVTGITLTTRKTSPRPSRRGGTRAWVNEQTGFRAGLALLEARALTDVEIDVVHHNGPVASIVELAGGPAVMNYFPHARVSWQRPTTWSFEPARHPALHLCQAAGEEGGTYPVVLSSANDEAVTAQIRGEIATDEIANVVAQVLDRHQPPTDLTLETVTEASLWAKEHARALIQRRR